MHLGTFANGYGTRFVRPLRTLQARVLSRRDSHLSRRKLGGVSLGSFIFVNGNRPEVWTKDARVHEYGHTIQSLIFGPLYLVIIALPSIVWCSSKSLHQKRMRGELNYYDLYCESSANTLGALVTKEEKPKRENTGEELRRRGVIKD